MSPHDNHKDILLYGALPTGLPTAQVGANQPKSLLLVFLADIKSHDRERLMRHIQPAVRKIEILTWYPNQQVLRSVAPQRGYSDSLANLYGLAVIAKRNGHLGFVVADELTKRQVEGQFPLRGEDERISLAMIAIREGEQNGQARIFAKRSSRNNSLRDDLESFDINQDVDNLENRVYSSMLYTDLGFEIHDPDQPAFTPTTLESFGHEETLAATMSTLSRDTPLPPELILDIVSRAEESMMEPIKFPPGLEFQAGKPTINIILCFEHTQEEREGISALLQSAIDLELLGKNRTSNERNRSNADAEFKNTPKPSITLIPWGKTCPLSRRDISEIPEAVNAYADTDRYLKMPYLLTKPIDRENASSTEFLSINRTRVGPCNCSHLRSFILGMTNHSILSHILGILSIDERTAFLYFFLTNKLSDTQVKALYKEIQTMNHIDDEDWGKKVICPVPWKEDEPDAEDGTPEDMWRLYTEVKKNCEPPLVFADLQSGEDLKIIMTENIYIPNPGNDNKNAREVLKGVDDPNYRGFIYGRLPGRDAHIHWINLNIANMNLDESLDDYETYQRPDWPFHHMLDEYNDWIPEEEANENG
ncbi:hypothetical protein N7450_005100 [Penicillium hetheringtonii]|uniref:Uncharacterized protein n=1 Tax=Penicillium hetheringtonii TaxID=911720 RepID=A0AAD6DRB4_9EURO|nr:hypothetical protein N7450_005100 [Penicillium hetheringtonii]